MIIYNHFNTQTQWLQNAALMLDTWQEMTDFVGQHQIRPVVGAVFPFEEIATAHELMESRHSYGKIVVRVT